MAKSSLSFVCQNCGAAYNRWQGKCESCGEWNTLVEEDVTGATTMPASIRSKRKGRQFALESLTGKSQDAPRLPSGMAELDRVTGGGFVRGSVLLVGGDPGIGKSTLLTQATSLLARAGHRAVYISGEEAVAQVRLRAERLGLADAPVQLAAETSVEDIAPRRRRSFDLPRNPVRRSFWSAMSPKTARSPDPVWSNTWWTRCCRSRAKARSSSGSCGR
jgi:DNA repair protein RadA/Sms